MSVQQKKDGRWFCVYYQDGRQIWEAFGRDPDAKTRAMTRDLEIKMAKLRKQPRAPMSGQILPFKELFQLYLSTRSHDLRDNTRDGIIRCVTRYAYPVMQNVPISQITLDHWRRMEAVMVSRGIKNRTINTYYKYLSNILQWAIIDNEGLLNRHPWTRRKRLKEERFVIHLFTLDELKRVIAEAEPHAAWAIQVAYYTGARTGRSELFALRWDHIDYPGRRLWIPSTKTRSGGRWQYPAPQFMTDLRRHQDLDAKEYPDCPWMIHYKGQPVQSLKTSFAEAKKKAGITRPIRLSDLRHYHITYALASGADIHELAARVGHRTPRMIVDVYSHLAKDILKNRAHTLPNLTPKRLAQPPMDILY